jgi:hypothetical protein
MDDEGDGYTLGLLVELRKLCTKIAEENHTYTSEVHRLLQQLINPNLHGLDHDLSFRVIQQTAEHYYGETLRTVSCNANLSLGRAALEAAIKQDPKSRWMLLYPGVWQVDMTRLARRRRVISSVRTYAAPRHLLRHQGHY